MKLNKDTQFCISLSAKPSHFGTALHNSGYEALGINFAYKAFATTDLKGAIAGVRALGIRGCSISMPFKESVIPFIDALDESAKLIGAVNTIVNTNGHLTGYNTDALGAKAALTSINADPNETVLLLGSGGVARAILFALRQLGFKRVNVASRNMEKAKALDPILTCHTVAWSDRHQKPASLIINATSIGMIPETDMLPVDESYIRQSKAVMDVVISPMETKFIRYARSAGKRVAPGYLMSLEQAMAQFTLYTGHPAPRDAMALALRELLLANP
jgi:shikimate dehydrogenase